MHVVRHPGRWKALKPFSSSDSRRLVQLPVDTTVMSDRQAVAHCTISIEPVLAVRPLSYMELRPDGRAIALLYNKGATWTDLRITHSRRIRDDVNKDTGNRGTGQDDGNEGGERTRT